jgi:hypothetical protein
MADISKVYLRDVILSHTNLLDNDMSFTLGELSTMCGRRLEDNPGKNSNSRNGIYNANKEYMIFPVTVRRVHSSRTAAVQAKYRLFFNRDVIIRC